MRKIMENNRKWVADKLSEDPDYFNKLAFGQERRNSTIFLMLSYLFY